MHLLFAVLLLGHWLLASDLHVDPRLAAGPPLIVSDKDTNWALFDSTVAAMRRADPNAPVVILAGDFLAHHFPHDDALAQATMARIVRTFDAAFPRAQFIIVPGNNDDPCGDYRVTPGTPYFKRIAHLWAPLVNRNGAAPNFERDFARYGWYSARLPVNGLRVLALDTVYWSIVYSSCRNNAPNAQREERWLAQSLQALPRDGRAVLVMHIPPGVDPRSTLMTHRLLVVPFWRAQYASAFARELGAQHARIAFAVAGHEHRDGFRLFGGVPMLVSPPVSPVYGNNPSFLRLDVAAGGALSDYTPFVYDPDTDAWRAQTSFDRTYGVRSFSAASLASIHDRLNDDTDLRRRWVSMFLTGADEDTSMWYAWRTYWCAQTNLEGPYVACAGLQRRVELLPIAGGVVAVALVALLAVLAVRLGRQRRGA